MSKLTRRTEGDPPDHGEVWVSLTSVELRLPSVDVGDVLGSTVRVLVSGQSVEGTVTQLDPNSDRALIVW